MNAAEQVHKAFIMLATDKLSGDALRHVVAEETAQALGLLGDSFRRKDSLFTLDRMRRARQQRLL